MDNNIGEARRHYALVNLDGEKYTQEDAARDFHVSLGTYRNWEQGVNKGLSGKQLRMIADKYCTTVDYLLKLTDKPERPELVTYRKTSEKFEKTKEAIEGALESFYTAASGERELRDIYLGMSDEGRIQLLEYARYLSEKYQES